MKEATAAALADEILKRLIEHQPEIFGKSYYNPEAAKTLGQVIAALRMSLIAQLAQQPTSLNE